MKPTVNTKTVNGGLLPRSGVGVDANIVLGKPSDEPLFFPLIDYYKRSLKPIVKPGDIVAAGEPLADGVLASTSGVVTGIEKRRALHVSEAQIECVILLPDKLNTAVTLPAIDTTDLESLKPYNIVGLGGAAFPLIEKLRSTEARGVELLIINAVECEPLISCDDALIQTKAKEVLWGINLLMQFCNATKCTIAIKCGMQAAIAALEQHMDSPDSTDVQNTRPRESPDEFLETYVNSKKHITLQRVEDKYPAGSERTLIRTLTSSRQAAEIHPSENGILVVNVATAYALYNAHQGVPLLGRIVTVTENTSSTPSNVWAPFGSTIREVLTWAGYPNPSASVMVGGPISGLTVTDLNVPITASVNSLVLNANSSLDNPLPCIRCGECATVCPSDLLPQQLYWYAQSGNVPALEKYGLQDCIECSCCDLVCPSSIPLTQLFRYAKSTVQNNLKEQNRSDWAENRYQSHVQRLEIRQSRRKQSKPPPTNTLERLKKQRQGRNSSSGDGPA